MATPHCFASLQTCAIRVALLEASGHPDNGATHGYVTDALTEMTVSLEVEDGDEFIVKNACGNICTVFRDCDKLKNVSLDATFCQLDAEFLSLILGGNIFTIPSGAGSGDTFGYQLPSVDASCPNGVSLEVWTKAWDGSEQALPAFLAGDVAYIHWVFPRVRFTINQLNFENDAMEVQVSGIGSENSNITANGPYDDWPVGVANHGGITNLGGFFLTGTLPTADCGFINVTSAAS